MPSGCARRVLEARGEQDAVALGRHRAAAVRATTARRADRQRAGLVDDQRIDALGALQRLGVLDQDARARAASRRPPSAPSASRGPARRGRRSPAPRSRASAPSPSRRARATIAANVATAITSTAGTNHAATRSTSRCTGAFEPCAAATWRTMPASSVACPTAVASQRERPCALTVPAQHRIAGTLQRPARSRRSASPRRPPTRRPGRSPSTGTRVAGADDEDVADAHAGDRHLDQVPVALAPGGRRLQRAADRGSPKRSSAFARPSSSLPSSTSVITIAPASK